MVKISVIVPIYNVENYLKECLESIINQSFIDFEIICVNDGSSDNSYDIIKEFEKKDSRIKIINQENKGLSGARNSGLDICQGEYIYFIDSDDYLELTALEELYDIANENKLDLILFKSINFDDVTGKKFTEEQFELSFLKKNFNKKIFSYKDILDFIFQINVPVWTKFFKRDLIEDIRFEEGLIFEDNLFFMEFIFNANKIYFYDKYLYNRRIRPNSILTSDNSKNKMDVIEIYKLITNNIKEHNYYDLLINKFFVQKTNDINYWYTKVDKSCKEEFFIKIKEDYSYYKEEYENKINFNEINEWNKIIYYNVLNSNNYKEFDNLIKIYKNKKEITKLTNNTNKENKENEISLNNSKKNKFVKPFKKIVDFIKR